MSAPTDIEAAIVRAGGLPKVRWPPYWADVRSISNTGAARIVILIPLVGYWIILNDHLLGWSKLAIDPSSSPSVSWRLFATYFGLCFIGIASAIYQWRCPREVKEHSSPTDYISAVSPHMSDIEEERVRRSLLAQSKAELERRHRQELVRPQIKSDDDLRRAQTIDRANVLQVHFDQCNRSCPTWRGAVAACYIAGAFILFWPTADIFRKVTVALVRAIEAQWFGL